MAKLIQVPTFKDDRGNLSVLDNDFPFPIRRVFYIYNAHSARGGHGHFRTRIALICISGKVRIETVNKDTLVSNETELNDPSYCLVLEPSDWHLMDSFSEDAVLLALASEPYDPNDYFYEKPEASNLRLG